MTIPSLRMTAGTFRPLLLGKRRAITASRAPSPCSPARPTAVARSTSTSVTAATGGLRGIPSVRHLPPATSSGRAPIRTATVIRARHLAPDDAPRGATGPRRRSVGARCGVVHRRRGSELIRTIGRQESRCRNGQCQRGRDLSMRRVVPQQKTFVAPERLSRSRSLHVSIRSFAAAARSISIVRCRGRRDHGSGSSLTRSTAGRNFVPAHAVSRAPRNRKRHPSEAHQAWHRAR